MAAKVLKGEASAKDMAYETFDSYSVTLIQRLAENLSLTVDESVTKDAEIFTEITE